MGNNPINNQKIRPNTCHFITFLSYGKSRYSTVIRKFDKSELSSFTCLAKIGTIFSSNFNTTAKSSLLASFKPEVHSTEQNSNDNCVSYNSNTELSNPSFFRTRNYILMNLAYARFLHCTVLLIQNFFSLVNNQLFATNFTNCCRQETK